MKGILAALADLVFPPLCIACGNLADHAGTNPFCAACRSLVPLIKPPICPRCGLSYPAEEGPDHLCGDCITSKAYYSAARAIGRYESVLLDTIHLLKYRGRTVLGEVLGRFMADHDYPSFRIADSTLIIPVPLHRKRLRHRGFNQSLLLAREIGKRHALPVVFDILERTVETQPQVNLGRDQRGQNVKGAFTVSDPEGIKGEKVLLVDDVYTTGSTVRECARVLRKAGAADVAVLTLARAV